MVSRLRGNDWCIQGEARFEAPAGLNPAARIRPLANQDAPSPCPLPRSGGEVTRIGGELPAEKCGSSEAYTGKPAGLSPASRENLVLERPLS
jgi:hypothetical protein